MFARRNNSLSSLPAKTPNNRKACHDCVEREERPTPAIAQTPPIICVTLQPNFFNNTEDIGPVINMQLFRIGNRNKWLINNNSDIDVTIKLMLEWCEFNELQI